MVQQANWWETTDPGAVAGDDGVDPVASLDEMAAMLGPAPQPQPAKDEVPVEVPGEPQSPLDASWAQWRAMKDEIPVTMNDGNGIMRFLGEVVDVAGKPFDTMFDALDYTAHIPERLVGMAYWDEYDMGTRWKLGGLTWEALSPWGDAEKDDVIRRMEAGEDLDKIIEENEGGFFDMAMSMITDPMNIFGVPFLGVAAKALPATSRGAKVLKAVNRGVNAETLGNTPLAKLMRNSGFNELQSERNNARVIENLDAIKRFDGTGWVKNAHDWAARPDGKLRRLVSLSPIAKRAEASEALTAAWMGTGAPMTSIDEAGELVRALVAGDWQSPAFANPLWKLQVQHSATFLPQSVENMVGWNRVDPPPAMMGLLALNEELRATGKGEEFFQSIADPENRALFYNNRRLWNDVFLNDLFRLSMGGDSRLGGATGALDHMFGIGGKFEYDDLGGVTLKELEFSKVDVGIEMLDSMHAHAKGVFGILFMNTPAYTMKNYVGNTVRVLGTNGFDAFRGNTAARGERLGRGAGGMELVKRFALDFGRAEEVGLKGLDQKKRWKDWLIRPFMKAGNEILGGDVPMMQRITVAEADRAWDVNWRMSAGVLPEFDATGMSDDAARTIRESVEGIRNPEELRELRDGVKNGSLGFSPAWFLLNKVLDEDGITDPGMRTAMIDLFDGGKRDVIENAYRLGDPDAMRMVMDDLKGSAAEMVQRFAPDQAHLRFIERADMGTRRVFHQNVIGRHMEELAAGLNRVEAMNGRLGPQFSGTMLQSFSKKQKAKLEGLYAAIDKGNLDASKRNELFRKYDQWKAAEWKKLDTQIADYFGGRPNVVAWWKAARNQMKAADARVSADRDAMWARIRNAGLPLDSDEAKDMLDAHDLMRSKEHLKTLDDALSIVNLRRYPQKATSAVDEAYDLDKGMLKLQTDYSDLIGKMQNHVDEMFTQMPDGSWAPRQVLLTPEEGAKLSTYLDDIDPLARDFQAVALQSGANQARYALLGYERRYGLDSVVKYVMPWGFWSQRMSHRYFRAAMSRPGATAALAVLLQGQRDMQQGLPDRIKGKLKIPVPFLPDWMGDGIYVDPVAMAFPIKTAVDRGGEWGEEESWAGDLLNYASSVGASPAPWMTTPLQLAGVFGERDRHIRYLAQGLPGPFPGTAAQRAIWGFLTGDPAETWQDAAPPEAIEKIMLGGAFPEPLLRDILGIPPGDPWDHYRINRMLANMAIGDATPEETLKAMRARSGPVWDKANERAETETGIRELSSWGLGLPGTIYPKGEEIQNGLHMIFRAAQEADRKDPAAQDAHIQAFFDAFPEYEVRQSQRAWYRGQQEMDSELDTKLYYSDLEKVQAQFDPEIQKLEALKSRLPKGARAGVSSMLTDLYSEKDARLGKLDKVYRYRKEQPSLYAPPHERALQLLRTAWFKLDGGDYPELAGRRELFLRSLTGKGIGSNEFTFTAEHDRILAEYDVRIGQAIERDKNGLYEDRKKAIESLTQKVMPLISREDFERYMLASKTEPEEKQAKQQRASDALRKFFGASDDARRQILDQFPDIREVYGENIDPDSASSINRWWDGYYALPPNSMDRDDYVESNLPVLNALRATTGLPPLTPRNRPTAPPILFSEDPFYNAIITGEINPVGQ